MGDDIVKGNVKLNYNVCEKKNATVGEGDMISCRGRGRVEVKEILEQQNDRYRIVESDSNRKELYQGM